MSPVPLVEFNTSYYRYPNNIGDKLSAAVGLGSHTSVHEYWLNEAARMSGTGFNQIVNKHFALPSDEELLRSILSSHGVFAHRFFAQSIRQRVTKRFAEVNIDIVEFSSLLWEAWERDTTDVIDDIPWAIGVIISHLYDQAFIRVIKDQRTFSELGTWFIRFAQPRGCFLCNRMFRVIDLPDWIYFGSNACIDCCFSCPMERPDKEELKSLIPAFVQACGFIPPSSATPINYAFCSRLSPTRKQEVFRAYALMGGIEHVKRKFGSWFNALAETGALPGGVLPTARGVRCLAQDGHVCHSLEEQRIDDWLSANDIPHEREPYYPADSLLNPKGSRRADWRVNESLLEYFGLVGDEQYDKKMSEKILLAQRHGINLIAIYPTDLDELDSRLGILREFKASTTGSVMNILVETASTDHDEYSTVENEQPIIVHGTEHELRQLDTKGRTASTTRRQHRRQMEENGIPVRWVEGVRLQQANDNDPTRWIEGDKLKPVSDDSGKALYRGQDGWAIAIEQVALEFYGQLGYTGRWTENFYWWGVMSLLFWDIIYARLPSVYSDQWPFPSKMQDIPRDFFSPNFYERRKNLIAQRIVQLTEASPFGLRKPNIESELRRAFRHYHNLPVRPAAWTKQFTEDDIAVAARALTGKQLMMIMHRLLENFGHYRTGMPDLFLARSDAPLFVEVKAAREQLKSDQVTWLIYLHNEVGLPVEICRVVQSTE